MTRLYVRALTRNLVESKKNTPQFRARLVKRSQHSRTGFNFEKRNMKIISIKDNGAIKLLNQKQNPIKRLYCNQSLNKSPILHNFQFSLSYYFTRFTVEIF